MALGRKIGKITAMAGNCNGFVARGGGSRA
jgi:hypothetical protein